MAGVPGLGARRIGFPGGLDMKRPPRYLAAAFLILSAGLVRADDTYPIKTKDLAPGDVFDVQKTETVNSTSKVVNAAGQSIRDDKQETVATSVYKETIIKCEPKKNPTVVERKYEKAVLKIDGKSKELGYQGKAVLIEKKDGKFRFTIDGKELSEDDARPLAQEFEREGDDKTELEKSVLPKAPVKIDESWKVDVTPFVKDAAKSGQMELDGDKAKGIGTLLKAYKKDDRQFGQVKLVLTFPIKSLGSGDKKLVADQGSVASTEMNLDGCIDGTSNTGVVKSTMKMEFKSSVPDGKGGKLAVTVTADTKSEEVRKELPKK
jgi:hypothetical protein